jgi:hypothetical protein
MNTTDLNTLRTSLTRIPTAELDRRLTKLCQLFARIEYFPDRRRALDRPYFALVDEIERRRTGQDPS